MSLSPVKRRILETIGAIDKPAKAEKIAKKVGLGFPTVMTHIIGLTRMGYVETPKRGYYIIAEKGKRALRSPTVVRVHHRGMLEKKATLGKRYVLESLVGKGTYGKVWKATDKSLERTVAIKVLHGGIKDFEQLKTEGKALSALTHKNIIIVYDLDSDEKTGGLSQNL